MNRHTLYAYVEGSDLHDVADDIESKLLAFVADTEWILARPWVVNQKRMDDPSLGPNDLPDWELGVNMFLPDPGEEPAGWFKDVEQIAMFLEQLHQQTGRDFVIGIGDNVRGYGEDLLFIKSGEPNLELLRKIVGVNEAG